MPRESQESKGSCVQQGPKMIFSVAEVVNLSLSWINFSIGLRGLLRSTTEVAQVARSSHVYLSEVAVLIILIGVTVEVVVGAVVIGQLSVCQAQRPFPK